MIDDVVVRMTDAEMLPLTDCLLGIQSQSNSGKRATTVQSEGLLPHSRQLFAFWTNEKPNENRTNGKVERLSFSANSLLPSSHLQSTDTSGFTTTKR
jgi:hypothetical protein